MCLIVYFHNHVYKALTSINRVASKQTYSRNDRTLKLHCHVADILFRFVNSLFLLYAMYWKE